LLGGVSSVKTDFGLIVIGYVADETNDAPSVPPVTVTVMEAGPEPASAVTTMLSGVFVVNSAVVGATEIGPVTSYDTVTVPVGVAPGRTEMEPDTSSLNKLEGGVERVKVAGKRTIIKIEKRSVPIPTSTT
jgi:hypothetical protein